MVSVRASHGAVWLLALDRALGVRFLSSLLLVCSCAVLCHILLSRDVGKVETKPVPPWWLG